MAKDNRDNQQGQIALSAESGNLLVPHQVTPLCSTLSGTQTKTSNASDGLLSRKLSSTLSRLGADPRKLRQLRKQFRDLLQPEDPLDELLFKRFWSSYLRVEMNGLLEIGLVHSSTFQGGLSPKMDETLPSLGCLMQAEAQHSDPGVPPSRVFESLALSQRYDRHFSREMMRALTALLLRKKSGKGKDLASLLSALWTGRSFDDER